MEALWDQIEGTASSDAEAHPFVPVDDLELFQSLAAEVARMGVSQADCDTVFLVDAQTAQATPTLGELAQKTGYAGCTEPIPQAWMKTEGLRPLVVAVDAPSDFFLVIISPVLSFAQVGVQSANGTGSVFRGGWTCSRKRVEAVLRDLAQRFTQAEKWPKPAPSARTSDFSLTLASHLMATMATQFAARQQNIAMDRHDLFSVLEILKAISSKRRAHDVLYVFVEQIARVIDTDRCSIVQVWGGERKGRVQASHEDETISDLVIDLEKYPELLHAMDTREKVVVNDVSRHRLTRQYAKELSEAGIRVLMVVPIVLFDPNVGSLFLRVTRRRRAFTLREIGFCEIVAEAAGNALERAQLFERIQRANERLERLAVTDALTGLYNRRHFHARLQEEFQRSKRYNLPLACLLFDIDDFKLVNDTYGHLQGDSVLREMSVQTNNLIRKTDICARYGGEEFVVIMPQTGLEGAQSQAQRLLEVLGAHTYPGMPPDTQITVSIGVAVLDLDTMDTCDALVAQADVALYEAKRAGKNRVVVAKGAGETT